MSLLVWWSHESAATGAKLLTLYRERTAEDIQPVWREEAAPSIYELAIQRASLNSPSQDKTHSSALRLLLITMPVAPNVPLRFGPPSPETPIPSLRERIARLKRKRRSSSSESSDYDNLDDETEEEEESQSSAEVQDQPRLFIRIPKRRTDTAKDDNSNGGNEVKQEEDSQNLAEEAQAVLGQPRLFIGIRLPKRETDTVKDDNSSDICHVQITRPATPLSETNTFAPTTAIHIQSPQEEDSDDFEYVDFCDPWEQLNRQKDPWADLPQFPQSDPEPYCPPQPSAVPKTHRQNYARSQHEYNPGYHANTPSGAYYSQPLAVVQAPLQGNALPQHGNYRAPSHSYQ
ncbi:hypothetical protein CY34DRAFT_14486 [Suillus luteus UH-Slu-Lm8-n1]|uniref:Unplaced genomic scaffold CY34scaffold_218, whole genome shotgun sequence n=1 Tax=Suillus luteus UH-Slu-Lm8-n1 TaxID=930992 RepID=A0A0D0AC04_9AGAM|nr:hypothetical protein CY34DRAFT_14486 [Suillus luteus UH-Slu-Lm8-n1]